MTHVSILSVCDLSVQMAGKDKIKKKLSWSSRLD